MNSATNAARPSGPVSARRSSSSLWGRRGTIVADMTPSAAALGSACSGNMTREVSGTDARTAGASRYTASVRRHSPSRVRATGEAGSSASSTTRDPGAYRFVSFASRARQRPGRTAAASTTAPTGSTNQARRVTARAA